MCVCDLFFHLKYYSYPVCILINAIYYSQDFLMSFSTRYTSPLIHPARSRGGRILGSAKNPYRIDWKEKTRACHTEN